MVLHVDHVLLICLIMAPYWGIAAVVRRNSEDGANISPGLSSEQGEGYGKCEFTHDCSREENIHCKNIADASCVCNHGTCSIRGHVIWFGQRQSECRTLQDCKNSGKCNGVPDSQCFCIDEQCEVGTEWECHETSDCGKMEKCRGKDCTCEDGTCEWECGNDDDCNNGPFYCDPLGYKCKCQNNKCDLVKLPTQCDENSGDGLRECVQKNFCKKDEPCQCLQDYCTEPWYVEKNVEILVTTKVSRDFNCRSTEDCTDTILDCQEGGCVCGDIVEHNWNKRGTCMPTGKTLPIPAKVSEWPESEPVFLLPESEPTIVLPDSEPDILSSDSEPAFLHPEYGSADEPESDPTIRHPPAIDIFFKPLQEDEEGHK